jgi:hypothetical protein
MKHIPWWLGTALVVSASLMLYSLLDRVPDPAPPAPTEQTFSPAEIPASSAPAAATAPKPSALNPVLDLFSPDAATLLREQSRAQVKNTIEQLFISTAMLDTCGLLTPEEKHRITAAGWRYATRARLGDTQAQLTETFQQLHQQAAESYRLVYHSATLCQDEKLPALRDALILWQYRLTEDSASHPK